MAPTPLCGSVITSRRSFLALAWTLTTLLSFFSFGVSVFLGIKITNQYNSMLTDDYADWYRDQYGNNNNHNNNDNRDRQLWDRRRYLNEEGNNGEAGGEGGQSQDELDEDFFESLATTNSRGLVFAGVYTTVLGIALSLYGSTVVIGFMSVNGEYIPPCFSFRSMTPIDEHQEDLNDEDSTTGPRKLWKERIHRGIFLGSVVIFSNLMLLCAIIFGELQVHDNYNNYDEQKHQNLFSYRIEKISGIFAVTCIILAFVYILFAVIYTTCGGLSDDYDTAINSQARIQSNWGNSNTYEMSNQINRGNRRRRTRQMGSNSIDKEEPLVGIGMGSSIPQGGITDNEGFITDMNSTSSDGSSSMGRMQLS